MLVKSIEEKISDILRSHPIIKKIIKRIYQRIMVFVTKPQKSKGDIIQISPNDEFEYFFGYYDKSPWNANESKMIFLRAKQTYKNVAPKESADIILHDCKKNINEVIGKTNSWNVQQGCMLQWIGPKYDKQIIYNDFRQGKFCAICYDIISKKEIKEYSMPIYSVSSDGKFALTLDFSRLHKLRPGYGYSNLEKKQQIVEKCPKEACIWKIDLYSGECVPILKYEELKNFEHNETMDNAIHKVNHIMISPDNERFMVLHRWIKGKKKYTRLLTIDIDGRNIYNLLDDGMISHCCWKDPEYILAWAHKETEGTHYYLLKDKTKEYEIKWKEKLISDGHPSYSLDKRFVVTDTYPNRSRISNIYLINTKDDEVKSIVQVFSPFRYDNEVRCDLHPRWDKVGQKICFDATFSGKREIYIVKVGEKEK